MKIILTGSTGMVGGGVLQHCLLSDQVKEILVINRKSCGVNHPKLKEILHADFYEVNALEEELAGYDACFFCLGISSVGLSKEAYYQITCELTLHFAEVLCRRNPQMTFCYISGAGTDSTEKDSRMYWARVKGRTENALLKMPFRQVYALRPGFLRPVAGQKNVLPMYRYLGWMFGIGRIIYPKGFCTLDELAAAMIRITQEKEPESILEVPDIVRLAGKHA